MNKGIKGTVQNRPLKRIDGRIKDMLLLSFLGLVLFFAAWEIFHTEENVATVANVSTDTENKVMRLLEEIEGVGNASVMICENEEGVQSVVVVCDGANDLRVLINVREAVAAALGTEENAVKIYLKKE